MGFNGGNDIDIDKLTHMLEDHRDTISAITSSETCKEGAAALPKLIFDLVSQSEKTETSDDVTKDDVKPECSLAIIQQSASAKEIVENLPKVWKVLIELLNHQQAEQVRFNVCI